MMEKVFVYTGTGTQPNITITRQEHEQLRSAWELVREIAAIEWPGYDDNGTSCFFCGSMELWDDLPKPEKHSDDCIWLQARQLVNID